MGGEPRREVAGSPTPDHSLKHRKSRAKRTEILRKILRGGKKSLFSERAANSTLYYPEPAPAVPQGNWSESLQSTGAIRSTPPFGGEAK